MTVVVLSSDRAALVAEVAAQVGSPAEARWIVEQAEATAGDGEVAGVAASLAARRRRGEPLQYVLGTWPFRTLELAVDPRVLIPRPETESVVEVALAELAALCVVDRPAVVADLGTGSGAIALSLAAEGAAGGGVEVWATDRSADALAVAAANRAAVDLVTPGVADRVHLVAGHWFAALPAGLAGRLSLVVSNPPYVSEEEFPGLDPVVRGWEPRGALVSADGSDGTGGTADIEAVVAAAPRWLGHPGVLVVEIAPHQEGAALRAARSAGFGSARVERDLAGRPRTLVAVR